MSHEIQTMMAEMEDMEHIKKTLTSWLKEEVNNGKECFDTKSCGDVSDIIKDMAETTKECYEACYYKTVIEAMKEGSDPAYGDGPYGYNHRHMGNGQFASSGRGHYVSGYGHGPYMDQMSYVDGYIHDPDFENRMQTGNNMNLGYSSNTGSRSRNNSKDGEIYDNYRDAMRHYQSSRSPKDKEKADEHCMMYMENTLSNLRSMWHEADPSLKSKMKKDFGDEIAKILEGM